MNTLILLCLTVLTIKCSTSCEPLDIEDGEVEYSSSPVPVGGSATVTCNRGFNIDGPSIVNCVKGGTSPSTGRSPRGLAGGHWDLEYDEMPICVEEDDYEDEDDEDGDEGTGPVPGKDQRGDININSCSDNYRCCASYAGQGYCKASTNYMKSCKASCGACTPNYLQGKGCFDYFTQCRQYAKDDECRKNLPWMGQNCRNSCNLCKIPREFDNCPWEKRPTS